MRTLRNNSYNMLNRETQCQPEKSWITINENIHSSVFLKSQTFKVKLPKLTRFTFIGNLGE